jgi:hypothetical protein
MNKHFRVFHAPETFDPNNMGPAQQYDCMAIDETAARQQVNAKFPKHEIRIVFERNRFKDALFIQSACNPVAITTALADAMRMCRAENMDTSAICNDPAVRLIVHQLAHLTNQYELTNSMSAYSHATQMCELGQDGKQFRLPKKLPMLDLRKEEAGGGQYIYACAWATASGGSCDWWYRQQDAWDHAQSLALNENFSDTEVCFFEVMVDTSTVMRGNVVDVLDGAYADHLAKHTVAADA